MHLDGGVAIRQGLDEDVIGNVTISTVPVVIVTGCRLFGVRPQTKTWTLASGRKRYSTAPADFVGMTHS